MSLSILLDEDSQAKTLVKLLKAKEHNVLTVNEVGLAGFPDREILSYAHQNCRVLITRNCDDFRILHQINPKHFGILAIYQDSDFSKNMTYNSIIKAIDNFENSNLVLEGEFIILNQWNY